MTERWAFTPRRISPEQVNRSWVVLEPMLQTLWDKMSMWTEMTLEDVQEEIAKEVMQLWALALDNGALFGLVLTELVFHKESTYFRIVGAVSKPGMKPDWRYAIMAFEQIAKDLDCSTIELVGRIGWKRELKGLGYRELRLMSKELTDG